MTLSNQWTLSFTNPQSGEKCKIPAQVPGNVHLDMQAAEILDELWPADDKDATREFSYVDDWTYETIFDAPEIPDEHTAELVFDGIDTIAEVYLNDELILEPQNMFIEHRACICGKLKPTANTLRVVIRSSELHARTYELDAFGTSRFVSEHKSQTYLRKSRHQWGWDNAPRLICAGIWRKVHIEIKPPLRFTSAYFYTKFIDEKSCQVGVDWEFATPDINLAGYSGKLELIFDGKREYSRDFNVDFTAGAVRCYLPRETTKLWWPRGYGKPNMYDAALILYKDGGEIARYAHKWGICTVDLLRTEVLDKNGDGEFVFIVNGEKVYINGTNWKPLHALHSQADVKVKRALDLAIDLNCNMIRIWGGGVYEDHEFFDYCNQNGLLVWQDFMFGCEFPPRDEWFCEIVAREAAWIVKKLRNHCSIGLWCGDNEDDMSHFIWDKMAPKNGLPSENLITRKVLKEAVLRYDPNRCYLESSPFFSDEIWKARREGNFEIGMPEFHLYPNINSFEQAFRETPYKFLGETGPIMISAVSDSPDIIARELPRAERLWDTEIAPIDRNIDMHQRDDYFTSWRQFSKEFIEYRFGKTFSYDQRDDHFLAANIITCCVFKDVIEYNRSQKWNKTGVLWWSLLDMWPMLFNYSVTDYNFNPKMAYYWIRQSQQYFCLLATKEKVDGEINLYVANETLERHVGNYTIYSISETGGKKDVVASGRFSCKPNETHKIQMLPEIDEPELWIIEWEENSKKYYNHYATGKIPFDFEKWRGWAAYLKELYKA